MLFARASYGLGQGRELHSSHHRRLIVRLMNVRPITSKAPLTQANSGWMPVSAKDWRRQGPQPQRAQRDKQGSGAAGGRAASIYERNETMADTQISLEEHDPAQTNGPVITFRLCGLRESPPRVVLLPGQRRSGRPGTCHQHHFIALRRLRSSRRAKMPAACT